LIFFGLFLSIFGFFYPFLASFSAIFVLFPAEMQTIETGDSLPALSRPVQMRSEATRRERKWGPKLDAHEEVWRLFVCARLASGATLSGFVLAGA